ncbi:uncharacterized protein FA14DRAFT_159996 [Meira miltonrushii]|uniref:Uncharacterized protein n=1 Tax=Meira miltonrushii TaxID=1280837 RepID=A0A316VMX3_9BASI|nr:uncharacterized protein FA14DRAFT_159996 [Meira miltonrushii]PWN38418.1 hypothetical protein FA14DRAFT_159996 [Meira miltonrushii]
MPALVPTAPVLAEPIQVAATSLSGLATSSNCTLQAIPTQSSNCHDVFALGEVYRFSAKNIRKRSKVLIAYVAPSTGVVVLDANTQATVSSASFSSSLRPITPPLVLQDNKFLASFVVLKSRSSDDWAELHAWIEEDQGPSTAPIIKSYNCQIDDDIISLHPLSTSELLARHHDGHFSIVEFQSFSEPKFHTKSTQSEKLPSNRHTLFIDVFDRTDIAYLPGDSSGRAPAQALIVLLTTAKEGSSASTNPKRKGRKSAMEVIDAAEAGNMNQKSESAVKVEYFSVGVEGSAIDSRIRKLGQTKIQLEKDEVISSASVRSSGALSMISENGRLISATLLSSQDGSPRIEGISSLNVSGITPSSNTAILRTSLSTALLTFSTVPSSGRALLNTLLVDTELDCVLAEQSWKAPEDHAQIFMQPLNMTKIASAITLAIPKSLKQTKPLIHIWNTSYQTGEGGHLRWALGSRHLTHKWIVSAVGDDQIGASNEVDGARSHEGLIEELKRISTSADKGSSNAKSVEKAFDDWLKSHQNESLPQAFVSELLTIALPLSDVANDSETSSAKPYPKTIVHHLLDQNLVHGVSLEPRTLVTALSLVGDWDAVYKALQSVKDLSEDDVVRTIRRAVHEESAPTTRLPTILTAITRNQFSSAELRKSMKDRLDEKCVEAILSILNNWLAPADGDALLKDQQAEAEPDKPSLLQALTFSTEVLDTFFPLMLVTPSLQADVQQLSTHVETHLSKTNVLNLLRGPLAAFAKLNDDRVREAEHQAAQLTAELAALQGLEEVDDIEALKRSEKFANGLYRTKGPDSSRGKQGKSSSQASIAQQIGAGSLSKSGQRQLTRKQQTYANNLAVGQYALEEFNP